MKTVVCQECGHPFKTTTNITSCGLGDCPSARPSTRRPARTSARGAALDDGRMASGAKRVTGGFVRQRSTGFGLLDTVLGMGKSGKAKPRKSGKRK